MNLRRPPHRGRLLAAAFACSLLAGSTSLAQGLTPDPYNIVGEGNGDYAPYMYAVEPTPGSMFPNQNRLQDRAGYRTANRFQSFMQGLDSVGLEGDDGGRRAGIGTPYYRANRGNERDPNRLYRPNRNADSSFYESQEARNTQYFKALQEKDPARRSKLLREYNLENLRAARNLSVVRPEPERDAARTAPRAPDAGLDPLLSPEAPSAPAPRRSSTGRGGTSLDRGTGSTPGAGSVLAPRGRSPLDGTRSGPRTGGTGSSLDPMNDPAGGRPSSRRSGLDPLLDGVAPRRSPSDVLNRSDALERRSPSRGVRRPPAADTTPPPPR